MLAALSSRDGKVGQSVRLKHFNNYQMDDDEICDDDDDIHGSRWMNPKDFGDLPTVPLAPPRGWHLWLCGKCLNKYYMDCHDIWYTHSCLPQDELKQLG